jgi:heptaprenylglyceryl phosphate synthase
MSLTSGTVSVGTAATLIDGSASSNPTHLHIHNNDNTDAVYIGGSNVTTSNGLMLQKLDDIEIILRPGNLIYAVSAKSGHVLSYLKQDY